MIRMYGVTGAGNSVAAFVHGFEPYFYVEAPSASFSPDDCQALTAELNVRIAYLTQEWKTFIRCGGVLCSCVHKERTQLLRSHVVPPNLLGGRALHLQLFQSNVDNHIAVISYY